MANNALKTPLSRSIGRHVDRRANDFQPCPAQGPAVPGDQGREGHHHDRVRGLERRLEHADAEDRRRRFSPYGRDPTQVGDKGYASPSDYYIGGINGLGGGSSNLNPRGNLTPLVFHPISQGQERSTRLRPIDPRGRADRGQDHPDRQAAENDQSRPTSLRPHLMRTMLGWGLRRAGVAAPTCASAETDAASPRTTASFMEIDKNGVTAQRTRRQAR